MSLSSHVDSPAKNPPLVVPTEPIWQLSVQQYHEMIRAGILGEDDPVELLEGWLVTKMMKNPPHCAATQLVRQAVERVLPDDWHVGTHAPVTLATSEPEPDVTVVRGGIRDYLDRHPGASEVALVVEVADASLERDKRLKRRIYAAAHIPEYWIVNLPERRLEVYREPSGPAQNPEYRTHQDYGSGDYVLLVIAGQELAQIAVNDLLP